MLFPLFSFSTSKMSDYNVTCPDFRFCQIKHTFASPCDIWNCNACWWHHTNCTFTPEPASDECPYVKCTNLPRPHSHTVTTIVSVLTVLGVLSLGGTYLYRRYQRYRRDAQEDVEREMEDEFEEEDERLPLLQRARAFFGDRRSNEGPRGLYDRFRAVIFGDRAEVAPPELPQRLPDREDHEPSAPPQGQADAPPPYEDINPVNRPIIRGRSLVNESFSGSRSSSVPVTLVAPREPRRGGRRDTTMARSRSLEMRQLNYTPRPSVLPRLEEVPLSQSLR